MNLSPWKYPQPIWKSLATNWTPTKTVPSHLEEHDRKMCEFRCLPTSLVRSMAQSNLTSFPSSSTHVLEVQVDLAAKDQTVYRCCLRGSQALMVVFILTGTPFFKCLVGKLYFCSGVCKKLLNVGKHLKFWTMDSTVLATSRSRPMVGQYTMWCLYPVVYSCHAEHAGLEGTTRHTLLACSSVQYAIRMILA